MTAWASLRFADAQRVEFSSLFLDADALRGICYATKTSFLGQPFGVIRGGLLSTGSHDWICTYLRALDDVCCRQVRDFPADFHPSFLLLARDENGEVSLPLRAMTYCQALRWLRHYLQLPWLAQPLALPELNFTAHSMKATLLSWALQVPGITEADRLRQGHHRRGSAKLYSRDDVLGQLRTQSAVRDAIRSGVHFSIPLHRGGQRPIQPIQVLNETFCKAASEQPWGFFEFLRLDLGESWVQANSEPDTHAEGPEPAVTDARSSRVNPQLPARVRHLCLARAFGPTLHLRRTLTATNQEPRHFACRMICRMKSCWAHPLVCFMF